MQQKRGADMQISLDAKYCGYYKESWQRKMINGIQFLYIYSMIIII